MDLTEAQIAEALNKHGVFLKKKVLHDLQQISGIQVTGEELGTAFGETRVIDIVVESNFATSRLVLSVECKRVFTEEKKWIFLRDADQRYRIGREVLDGGNTSIIDMAQRHYAPVCSEGYEITAGGKGVAKADQDPIFRAASQLSFAFLGLVRRRIRDSVLVEKLKGRMERHVPVLVTNAELLVVKSTFESVNLDTGHLPGLPDVTSVDALILNHPAPSPDSVSRDFRQEVKEDTWNHVYKESVWVVHTRALGRFFAVENLATLA